MLDYPKNYVRDALIRFTYHSNAIEGNYLSLGQTEAIVLYGVVTSIDNQGVKLRDIYEASNQKDAFYLMLNLAANDAELSIDNILQLQFELTKNTIGTAGKFKQNENMILGADFQTASVAETPIAVAQWAENTNYRLKNSKSDAEFIENLMAAHIEFERIHPFEDDNGRTGRELINLELAKNEMPFLVIEKEDKAQYITYEADQDVASLAQYAKQKLADEKKRYDIFEQNFKAQKEFDDNHQ